MQYHDIQRIADNNTFNFLTVMGQMMPTVIVVRNSLLENNTYVYVEDTGDNITDTILLVDNDRIVSLKGRSYPHIKYQEAMYHRKGYCNYIASGFYPHAWRKGFHKGYPALVQNQSFTVWRSNDMDLHVCDKTPEDDYVETRIVADNLHGNAPYSAGCVTVVGTMNPPSEDWEIVFEWLYNVHKDDTYVSAIILQHEDLDLDKKWLRLGSQGGRVIEMQKSLHENGFATLKMDGFFGPITFEAVRRFQRALHMQDTGIWSDNYFPILKHWAA